MTGQEHIDTLDKPADYNPDVLGWYGLEYDGPRCAGGDCRVPVEDDGDYCIDCLPPGGLA